MLDTSISYIAIKWIFGASPKMTLFELIGRPLSFFSGTVTTQYQYGYAGIRTDDAAFIEALKSAKGIKLTVKGDGKKYSVRIETTDRPDYCFHQFTFPTSGSNKTFEIPFTRLTQEPWGKAAKFDPSKIKTVSIHTVGQPIPQYSLDIVKLELLK